MKHTLERLSAVCFDYGCSKEVGIELLAHKQELQEKLSDLQNQYDKLPILSKEAPEIRGLIDFIKELLGEEQ